MQQTSAKIHDVTIVGAGPVGLFAVFYAGMRKLSVHLVDSLAQVGGQLTALYPEKSIYDMPGFPEVRAKKLVDELFDQAKSAAPDLTLNCKITRIRPWPSAEARTAWALDAERGDGSGAFPEPFVTKTIILALGMGAFRPRRLEVPGLDALEGKQVQYVLRPLETYRDRDVLVIGGGDSAADWTLALAKPWPEGSSRPLARSVTQIHRGAKFTAHEATVAEIQTTQAKVWMNHELRSFTVLPGNPGRVRVVLEQNITKDTREIEVDDIVVCVGYIAKLDFVKDSGITMQGNAIKVNSRMETNLPGVFACGDVVHHEAKLKLIATGVGEAAIAANIAKTIVDPSAKAFPGHSTSLLGKAHENAGS